MIARLLGALRGSLLGAVFFPGPEEIPPIPPRFEIRDDSFGVMLLDHATAKKYPFTRREFAELAQTMLAEKGLAPIFGRPFTKYDYREARS